MALGLLPAQGRVGYRGVTINRRTRAALEWAQARTRIPLVLGQGSYHPGVGASAGTHDGGGVVDISMRSFTGSEGRRMRQRINTVRALKDAGFAVWHRDTIPNLWPEHIHAVLIGDPELAPGAASQVVSFDAGRDGLRGNRVDDTYRPAPRVRFSYPLGRPVRRR